MFDSLCATRKHSRVQEYSRCFKKPSAATTNVKIFRWAEIEKPK